MGISSFNYNEQQTPQMLNMEEAEEIIKACQNKVDDVSHALLFFGLIF